MLAHSATAEAEQTSRCFGVSENDRGLARSDAGAPHPSILLLALGRLARSVPRPHPLPSANQERDSVRPSSIPSKSRANAVRAWRVRSGVARTFAPFLPMVMLVFARSAPFYDSVR